MQWLVRGSVHKSDWKSAEQWQGAKRQAAFGRAGEMAEQQRTGRGWATSDAGDIYVGTGVSLCCELCDHVSQSEVPREFSLLHARLA